jgi:hypothetical protein
MHLDGVETPEPLHLYLTTKTRFSAQLAALFQAESEGKGLSELQLRGSPSHSSGNVDEELYNDADLEDAPEAEMREQLLEEQESTEMKKADSSEQQATNTDQVPESAEASLDVPTSEPEAAGESEISLEAYQEEGQIEETEDQSLELQEHFDDNTQNLEENVDDTLYQEAEEPQDEVDAALEESVVDQTVDLEEGDVGSSGSSTVQGENDAFPTGQSLSAFNPDDWLTMFEEASNDSIPTLQTIPEVTDPEENAPQSGDDPSAHAKDGSSSTALGDTSHDLVEHVDDQTAGEQTHDEYEEHAFNLEAVNQEWNPDEYEEEYNAEDADYDALEYHEGDTSVTEGSWAVLDNQNSATYTDNYGNPLSPSKLPTTPGGLDQIPEEDEDEDSITYDDDLDEEQPVVSSESQIDASQARPTNSPLGKRSREENAEGGGDEGSDQGSYKRFRLAGMITDLAQIRR